MIAKVLGLGGGDVQVWTEDNTIYLGVAPHGANRYVLQLLSADAQALADALTAAVEEDE